MPGDNVKGAKGKKSLRLGELLVHSRVIKREQLDQALDHQKNTTESVEDALKIGLQIVELGFAREREVIDAINRYYGLSVKSLSDDIKGEITRSLSQKHGLRSLLYPPIWIRLSVAISLIICATVLIIGYFVLKRQAENLYAQTVKTGMVSLNYFTGNAKIPLIKDDMLRLNSLIKEAAKVDGMLYAFILDKDRTVQAHTNFDLIGKKYKPFLKVKKSSQDGLVTQNVYSVPGRREILDLSTPVTFKEKVLGEVHVGVSLDFIGQQVSRERRFIVVTGLLMVLVGVGLAVLLSLTFSRPIASLVKATRELGRGNYTYEVDMDRSDELGVLADSFNSMANELHTKSLMQETFGRYLSPEILDMILANPEETWLKGTRGEASILFTDIRGFTAYSEANEPERVVEDLNEAFDIATRAVLEHGGYVDKFVGDALLGVFGVPVARADHAERAVRAAMTMQQDLQRAAEKSNNELLSKIGIGINSGVVVSGNIGSEVKMEYSIIGDSVNLASRVTSFAASREVIVTEGVYQAVSDIVEATALEPREVKGKVELVRTYLITAIKDKGGQGAA